jgi:hypothetical protein
VNRYGRRTRHREHGCVTRPTRNKKPARELRQGGSYYRCCIPALAGFVSPQSVAPDGGGISSHPRHAQLENAALNRGHGVARAGKRISALTVSCASVCIERVKWLALPAMMFVVALASSCTTLVNRRDLYSPGLAPDSLEAARQWYRATTAINTTRTTPVTGEAAPPPEFRY